MDINEARYYLTNQEEYKRLHIDGLWEARQTVENNINHYLYRINALNETLTGFETNELFLSEKAMEYYEEYY